VNERRWAVPATPPYRRKALHAGRSRYVLTKDRVVFQVVLCLFVVLTVGIRSAWAQAEGVVRGRVVAAADGSALAQVPVTLTSASGESLYTSTDVAGRFTFPRMRPGEYVLSAAAEGFSVREVRLVLEPREVRVVTVRLDVGRLAVSVNVTGDIPLPSTRRRPELSR
jgi:hypothetical protein